MNTESNFRPLESRLLSMLRPGEMLRFVFDRTGNDRMAVALEGAAGDSNALMQRISTILDASRGEGYVFRSDPGVSSDPRSRRMHLNPMAVPVGVSLAEHTSALFAVIYKAER